MTQTREERRQWESQYRKRCPQAHREWQRWSRIKRKYGLSKEAYEQLFARQFGRCGICVVPLEKIGTWPNKASTAYVDHDHETGQVRGLLCYRCNRALGGFLDSARVLRAAAEYIERPRIN